MSRRNSKIKEVRIMKKIIAMLAFTAVLCSCVSCGQDPVDEVSEESSVMSVSEISEEETTEEMTEEETTEEITETESENVSDYEEAIKTYFKCAINNDMDGMMKNLFPEKYIDAFKFMSGESFETSFKAVLSSGYYSDYDDETVKISKIISETPLDEEEIEMFYEFYGTCQLINEFLDMYYGMDIDDFNTWRITSKNTEIPKPYFDVDDVFMVNCLIEFKDSDGYKYIKEQEFIIYYVDGEGWKTDISMLGYIKRGKQKALASMASTITKASISATVDMDDMGIEYPEKCIICSDSSKNYNVTDDFVSQFEKELEIFCSDYKKYDYIIVIDNSCCVYTACADINNHKYIGTYPANKIYSAEGDFSVSDMYGEYTFDEICNICLEEIKK